jgi:hypothetical protein
VLDHDAAARDDEDAAVVVTVLAALAGAAAASRSDQAEPRSFWGVPAFRIVGAAPGPNTWWASGLPR